MRLLTISLMGLATVSLWASRNGDIREHTRNASSIVLGEVAESRSYYGTDGEIYTDVTLNVTASLKGASRKSGAVRFFTVKGGAVGDTRVMFTDVPTFELNEAAVVFLEGDEPSEKYAIRGGWVPELNARATKVLETIEGTLEDQEQPVLEGERQRAHAFLSTMAATSTAPDAGCYVLIGPKWTETFATYKIGTTIPATWKTALDASASTWTTAGTVFAFKSDAASANEILVGPVSGATTLASTRIEYDSTNRMRKFTMTFNANYNWSPTGEAGLFDVQSVTSHELGHALGLNHPSATECSEQTMWASAAASETKKRTLENGDKAGIAALYAVVTTPTPAPAPTPTPAPAPTPTPAPAPVPAAPVLSAAYVFPSTPRAGQGFTLWLTGSAFSTTTSQVVISGPGCPSTCVLTPSYRSVSLLSASPTLSVKGAYTVAVRNGATGALSAAKPFTVVP